MPGNRFSLPVLVPFAVEVEYLFLRRIRNSNYLWAVLVTVIAASISAGNEAPGLSRSHRGDPDGMFRTGPPVMDAALQQATCFCFADPPRFEEERRPLPAALAAGADAYSRSIDSPPKPVPPPTNHGWMREKVIGFEVLHPTRVSINKHLAAAGEGRGWDALRQQNAAA